VRCCWLFGARVAGVAGFAGDGIAGEGLVAGALCVAAGGRGSLAAVLTVGFFASAKRETPKRGAVRTLRRRNSSAVVQETDVTRALRRRALVCLSLRLERRVMACPKAQKYTPAA
jgi:hypothetical protein